MNVTDTATQVLDAAQLLVQKRGFNAFSYGDLSAEVGIKTASIHYHFKGKAELGRALMERYLVSVKQTLAEIDGKDITNRAKLKRFIRDYRKTEEGGGICLCGSLAADLETLPQSVRSAVADYLETCTKWLAAVIEDGVRAGEFASAGKPRDLGSLLLASLQGGLIVSRATENASVIRNVERAFFASLKCG